MMKISEEFAYDLFHGKYDGDLQAIMELVKLRLKSEKTSKISKTMSSISVGEIVIIHGIKPAYMNGARAELVEKKRSRVVVQLFRTHSPRFRKDSLITVPANCVKPDWA